MLFKSVITHSLQVFALKSDGRRQKISYSLVSGNDDDVFEINSISGVVRVRNSRLLDYEKNRKLHLTLAAQTENTTGNTPLFAFAELMVHLYDQNDNAPVFSQEEYFASVLEGITRGTYVIRVSLPPLTYNHLKFS